MRERERLLLLSVCVCERVYGRSRPLPMTSKTGADFATNYHSACCITCYSYYVYAIHDSYMYACVVYSIICIYSIVIHRFYSNSSYCSTLASSVLLAPAPKTIQESSVAVFLLSLVFDSLFSFSSCAIDNLYAYNYNLNVHVFLLNLENCVNCSLLCVCGYSLSSLR